MISSGFRVANDTARWIVALAGTLAMAWAIAVFPTFSSEMVIVDVAKAVAAGEAFRPEVLAAVDAQSDHSDGQSVRSLILGKAAIIRLRLAEDAIRVGDSKQIDRRLGSLSTILDTALSNAPADSFLWLARFWVDNIRNGFRLENLRELQMSYDLGRHEGWIAIKRNRFALVVYSVLPSDLAELAVSEFVDLVRWGFAGEAADIAAGPGLPLRNILFPRLKDLKVDQRLPFAQAMYRRDLDDVLVPGIAPPSRQIPMPALPPGF
jgi:hypothetical protein